MRKLEQLVREDTIKGIASVIDYTDRKLRRGRCRLHIVLKRDADKEVVLNQLFQFSPLQKTVSVILLALVGNRPKMLTIKEMLQEFIRHRVDCHPPPDRIPAERSSQAQTHGRRTADRADRHRRGHSHDPSVSQPGRGQGAAATDRSARRADRARTRRGRVSRCSRMKTARSRLTSLSPNQSEAIVSMQLGSLANLEREKLSEEIGKLLADITEYLRLLSDEANIRAVVRRGHARHEGQVRRQTPHGDHRRRKPATSIAKTSSPKSRWSVTLSQRGYIKRTAAHRVQAAEPRRQGNHRREDRRRRPDSSTCSSPARMTGCCSSPTKAKSTGRRSTTCRCRAARRRVGRWSICCRFRRARRSSTASQSASSTTRFDDGDTQRHREEDAARSIQSRLKQGGIIAIIAASMMTSSSTCNSSRPAKSVLLATANGMSIRFAESDARSMGRATQGVRGIRLSKGDFVIGMVIADPAKSLLTVCENGYGKRTPFGIGESEGSDHGDTVFAEGTADTLAPAEADDSARTAEAPESDDAEAGEESAKSGNQYRLQGRGGKGVRDIKTTARNGKAVDIVAVTDADEVLMVTASGKIQRLRAGDISVIGRNTQGVRIIRLEDDDKLVSMACIPAEIAKDGAEIA